MNYANDEEVQAALDDFFADPDVQAVFRYAEGMDGCSYDSGS